MAKIGVFICHCGSNIAGVVDIPRVLEAAKKIPGVSYVEDNKFTCSELGQGMIKKAVKEKHLDRVVIGACSPRMHENTFRKTVAQAGLNPYLLEIANLREHSSWVHGEDHAAATSKAIDLVQMAVAKVAINTPLYPRKVGLTKRALVIGGGIAGIQAALDIASAGHEVVLVEKQPTIGGRMAQLDKTFPTLDCSSCILSPKMVEIAQHPKITTLTYAEVKKVEGFVGNFEVQIVQKARKVDHNKCTGCGSCWMKCPAKVKSEFDMDLGQRTAIYIPFPQAVPNKPVIDCDNCLYIKYQDFVNGSTGVSPVGSAGVSPVGSAGVSPVGSAGVPPVGSAGVSPVGSTGVPPVKTKKPMQCRICEKICPVQAIDWEQQEQVLTEKFGAIVVATGFKTFDHSVYGEYGGGKYPDVITSLQLERLLSSSGPTSGEVKRPSDGAHPKTVVFVSCVGSRDEKVGRPYCSKVCCMYQAKQSIMLKEHDPEVQSYIFYIDIRAGGKDYEEFVRRAQEEYGTVYLRGRVSKIYQQGKKLIVLGEDSLIGRPVELEADLVVLATGIEPSEGAGELAQKVHVSHDTYGFMVEAHPKLKPVETSSAGIYLAGVAVGPRDIPESVAHGGAAASKVAGLFSQPDLTTEPMTAIADQQKCVGCWMCIQVCPFNAIEKTTLRDGRQVSQVNESLCAGCGLCASVCRPGAMNLKGFTSQQLLAEVVSLWK